jgi:hypothetical protein
MGAIISFFRSIKEFFENVLQIAVAIGQLFVDFASDPLGTLIRIFVMLVGAVFGVLLMLLWLLMKPVSPLLCGLLALIISWFYSIIVTIASSALWCVYFIVTLLIYTFDFFTGGFGFRLFLCEEEVDEWAMRGNFANGNKCDRALACRRPCGDRYEPIYGGMLCKRNPDYQPSLCPQQHAYRTYIQETDKEYAEHLGKLKKSASPMFDMVQATPAFRLRSKDGKLAFLRDAFRQKQKYLTKCFEAMQPYDAIAKNLCANAPLLFRRESQGEVEKVCQEIYCTNKYVPRGVKPSTVRRRAPGEEEAFCSRFKDPLPPEPEAGEDMNEIYRRILVGTIASVTLYAVILSVQKLSQEISQ